MVVITLVGAVFIALALGVFVGLFLGVALNEQSHREKQDRARRYREEHSR
jgi:H+/Cl- antiporter ClcA